MSGRPHPTTEVESILMRWRQATLGRASRRVRVTTHHQAIENLRLRSFDPGPQHGPLGMFGHVEKHAEDHDGDQCQHDVKEDSPDEG